MQQNLKQVTSELSKFTLNDGENLKQRLCDSSASCECFPNIERRKIIKRYSIRELKNCYSLRDPEHDLALLANKIFAGVSENKDIRFPCSPPSSRSAH